jgi:hemerythrin-like domain-containing protein
VSLWRYDASTATGGGGVANRRSEMAMDDGISRWHQEHVNFGRLLDLLEQQLDGFHSGRRPDYELMLDVMYYMTHWPDVMHHRREDLAFERIKGRDSSVAPIVDELLGQHAALRRDGNALVESLDDIVNGAIRTRESVETPGRAYIECFRKHIDTEESALTDVARRVLTAKDWSDIEAVGEHVDDPLFGPQVTQRFAALRAQIRREATL